MQTRNLTATAKTRIHASPDKVFAAFSEAQQMSKFWFHRDDAGLVAGERVKWSIGSGESAFSFEVTVKEVQAPKKLVIEWTSPGGVTTEVTWTFEGTPEGDTILTIVESGYQGNDEAIINRVLDSTGGFNQVIVAAKALVEHGVGINVVAAHV